MKKPFDLNADYQPDSFEFTKANQKKIEKIIAKYPKGRQKSATMPLLDLAQRQMAEQGMKANPPVGGWIPRAAMDEIAKILDVPAVKVYEVASFYSIDSYDFSTLYITLPPYPHKLIKVGHHEILNQIKQLATVTFTILVLIVISY